MLYAILCYNSEEAIGAWSKEYHDETMTKLYAVNDKLAKQGRLGPVARLLPTTAATTLRKGREEMVIDGPFAETKEQLARLLRDRLRLAGGRHRDREGTRQGQSRNRQL